jgi:DNA primase
MSSRFRTATEYSEGSGGGHFGAADLADSEKRQLCEDLLVQFGALNVRETSTGELIHSCVLPFGGHRNGDAHPSARLNYQKLTYICDGCGNSGGLLWFIAVCSNSTGEEARKWLNKQAGTGSEVQDLSNLLTYFDQLYQTKSADESPLPSLSPAVLDPWMWIHPYLTEFRGIPEATIEHFKVGWNPDTNRIVIPQFWRGQLVGWQTRRLLNDGTPKYQNSPDFPKDKTLYNFDQTRSRAIVVESPMSVLAKYHLTPEIEATFGANVTDRQVRLLTIHREVVLFMDNDSAGWSAVERMAPALLPYSNVLVAANPWAEDAAGLSEVDYMRCIEEAIPYALWTRPDPDSIVVYEEVRHGQDPSGARGAAEDRQLGMDSAG